jgi:hypothetical protein
MKTVLNVGGNSKNIPLPSLYEGWKHLLLDIDPTGKPDVVLDARELTSLTGANYDSVYCSHNLEHYYRHDVAKVLAGFHHVLKEDGFIYIRVPDIQEIIGAMVRDKLDIDDVLYQSPAGPITVLDTIYGFGKQIEKSGNEFYAHKTGFTIKALIKVLKQSGFKTVYTGKGNLEIIAYAFKNKPSQYVSDLLKIPQSY